MREFNLSVRLIKSAQTMSDCASSLTLPTSEGNRVYRLEQYHPFHYPNAYSQAYATSPTVHPIPKNRLLPFRSMGSVSPPSECKSQPLRNRVSTSHQLLLRTDEFSQLSPRLPRSERIKLQSPCLERWKALTYLITLLPSLHAKPGLRYYV